MKNSIIILFLLFVYVVQGQHILDSLHQQLAQNKANNTYEILLDIASQHSLSAYDSAEFYCKKIIDNSTDKTIIAKATKILGNVNLRKGDLTKAEQLYLKSLEIFKSQKADIEIAKVYNNLGMLNIRKGNNIQAINNLNHALTYYKQNNNQLLQTGPLINLGLLQHRSGNYPLAIERFRQAKNIAKAYGKKDIESNTSINLGAIYEATGKYDAAILEYQHAIDLAKEINDNYGLAITLNNVGIVYEELGDLNNAVTYFNKSLKISRQIDAKIKIANSLIKIGDVYSSWDKHQIALEYYFDALEIAKKSSAKIAQGNALIGIANTYSANKIFNKSLDYYNQAIKIFEAADSKIEIAEAYCMIGRVYADYFNNFEKTNAYLLRAKKIMNNVDAPSVIADIYLALGENYLKQKQYKTCIKYAQKSLQIKKHNPEHQYQASLLLAQAYHSIKQTNKSIGFYQDALHWQDSLYKLQAKKHEANFTAQYNLLKKEKEIALLTEKNKQIQANYIEKKNSRNMLLIFSLLLVATLFVMLVFYQRLLRSNKLLKQQKEEIDQHRAKLTQANELLTKAKNEAEQLSSFKNQFLANISHEIRTPLNAILGYAKLLSKNLEKESSKIHISNVIQSTENLMVIINDLLDFSKIEAGKMVIEQVNFSPIKVITQTITTLKFRAEEKNIRFEIHIDPTVPQTLLGDPYRLVQILTNLITNAIKYSNSDQIIGIEAKAEINDKTCNMEFAVKDNGIGIAESKLQTIFDSFTRVINDTARQNIGTGLGLAIVKRLIDLQHGHICVKSKVGSGTTFKFNIPYSIVEQPAENITLTKAKTSEHETTIKILLVEDNEINQELAKDTIYSWHKNFTVDVAKNGKEALEYLQKNMPDLILMDIQMPVMDGHEATQYIRSSLPKPKCDIPIIGMTAHAITTEKERALKNGMNEYIIKPFNPEELKQKIISFVQTNT